MEECTQITLDEWSRWNEEIKLKLAQIEDDFIYIGYLMKQIRDSGMFDGCKDIFEFAQKEYGLGKSTVSRFIAINEKFSQGGNSIELKDEYRGLGSSKLAEMLTLSDSECLLITEKTTVSEIRELKRFDKNQVPDAEVIEVLSPLQKCIVDFFRDKKKQDVLEKVIKLIEQEEWKSAADVMNPGEYTTHKKGIVYLFMYDWNTGIKYKLMTEEKPIGMSWPELLTEIYQIYHTAAESENGIWAEYYGTDTEVNNMKKTPETLTLQDSVATSQQEEENEEDDIEEEQENEPKKTMKPLQNQANTAVATSQQKSELQTAKTVIKNSEPVQNSEQNTISLNVYKDIKEPDQPAGIKLHSESMSPTQMSGTSKEILEGEVIDNQEERIKELLKKLFDDADLIESEQAAVDWLSKQDRNIVENLVYAFEKADFRAIY